MGRTVAYLSLINSGMILFLTLSRLKELQIIEFDIGNWFFPLLIFGYLSLLFIGWLDVRIFKGLSTEQAKGFRYNPELMAMKEKIINMERILQRMEKNEKRR